eukprot:3246726-Rhodomonas_salina.1
MGRSGANSRCSTASAPCELPAPLLATASIVTEHDRARASACSGGNTSCRSRLAGVSLGPNTLSIAPEPCRTSGRSLTTSSRQRARNRPRLTEAGDSAVPVTSISASKTRDPSGQAQEMQSSGCFVRFLPAVIQHAGSASRLGTSK